MSEYFRKLKSLGANVKVKLNLINYATKVVYKIATGADTSEFAKKVDLARLKSDVDKLDTNKLKNVPINLSNLKHKVDKLDIEKLETTPTDLGKLCKMINWFKKLIILILLLKMSLKKIQTFDSSIFIGQRYLENDGSQNFLIFQRIRKTLKDFLVF